jgi:hypothetical protein
MDYDRLLLAVAGGRSQGTESVLRVSLDLQVVLSSTTSQRRSLAMSGAPQAGTVLPAWWRMRSALPKVMGNAVGLLSLLPCC